MPDNVLFSAEYDNSKFVAGVTGNIESLKALQATQKSVQDSLSQTEKKLNEVESAIQSTNEQLASLDKTSADYNKTQQSLTTRAAELLNQSKGLQSSLSSQKTQLDQIVQVNAKVADSFNKISTSQKEVINQSNKSIAPIFDPANILNSLAAVKDKISSTLIGGTNFDDLAQKLIGAKGEFDQLGLVVDKAKEKLATLNPNSQEFKDLSQTVELGNNALTQYNELTKQSGVNLEQQNNQITSVISRVRAYNNELVRLTEAGLQNTAEFRQTQEAAAALNQEYSRILLTTRELGSETKYLDFGLSSIQAAASGYQTLIGVQELFGISVDKDSEAQKKLLAVLNLTIGLQQLTELLSAKGKIVTIGATIATDAYAAANLFLAESFGAAATAASVFRGILITTGIGALIAGIGFLIYELVKYNSEQKKTNELQQTFNEIVAEGDQKAASNLVNLKLLYEATQNLTLSEQERLKAAKELNKEYPETFKNYTAEQILLGQAKTAYDDLTKSIIANAQAEAAKSKIIEIENKILDIQYQKQKIINATANEKANVKTQILPNPLFGEVAGAPATIMTDPKSDVANILERRKNALAGQDELIKKLKAQETAIIDFVGAGNLVDAIVAADTKKGKEDPENEYLQKRKELLEKLAALNTATLTTYQTIREKVAAEIAVTENEIDSLLSHKKLTAPQADDLRHIIGLISDATLKKEFADYDKARNDAQKSIDENLLKLQQEDSKKRLDNISDEFQKSMQALITDYTTQKQNLVSQEKTDIDKANEDFAKGLFGDPASVPAQQTLNTVITQYEGLYNRLFDDLDIYLRNKKAELAAKAFQTGLEAIQSASKVQIDNISVSANKEIIELGTLYVTGKINYEKYQEALTKISHDETLKRLSAQKNELTQQIAAIDVRSTNPNISGTEFDNLQNQREQLSTQLSDVNKQISDANTESYKDTEDKNLQHLHAMLDAYGSFVDGVLNFIQVLDQAESARLDRQIAYQQQRVTYAQAIAAKGNADYLELEQKRLDTLQQQQEAHAAKQLAIDNALTLSKAALAAVGAVADAVETGNPFAAIAAVVAVIGALAAAINFANSFKVPVQTFAEGTEFVQLNGNKPGIDTVPAKLTEGERVVDKDTNKAYNDVLHVIHNKRISANALNDFVNNYPRHVIPITDYSRLDIATEQYLNKTSTENQKLDLIHQQLLLLNENIEGIEPVNLDMNMNEHGFAFSILSAARKIKIRKRF